MFFGMISEAALIIPELSGIFKRQIRKYNGAKGVVVMISYAPLWKTLKAKGITTYALIKDYGFSRGTLDSLKHDRNVSTATLNDICNMLECSLSDVIQFIPDK